MSKKIGKYLVSVTLNSNVELQKDVLSNWEELSDYAKYFLSKIESNSAKERKIEIWEVSGAEMGFDGFASLKKIRERAFELGFIPLPVEAVFLASLQYDGIQRHAVIIPEQHYSTRCCYTIELTYRIDCGMEDSPNQLWVPKAIWLFEKRGDK